MGILAPTVAVASLAMRAAAGGPLEVVASIHPLELLAREVGGERVRIHTLVPPGASPHTFEPRPSDMARLASADLFVQVGGGVDDWAGDLSSGGGGRLVLAAVPARDGAAPADPHVWLDPLRVRDALAPAISRALVERDPEGGARYRELLDGFQGRLTRLDAEIRQLLAGSRGRSYVAFHAAWRHFAARYELRELAVVQESPGEEPTPREVARLVEAAGQAGIPAILIEPQLDPRLAAVIAREFGGATRRVDPLGDPEDPERSSYEGLLRFNARAFREALGGRVE